MFGNHWPTKLFFFFLSWRYNPLRLYFSQPRSGLYLLILEVSWSHTTTRQSRQDSSGRVINPSQRPLPDNTQHLQQKNIHAPGGIRTHLQNCRYANNNLNALNVMSLHSFDYIMSCNVNILPLTDASSQARTQNFSLEEGRGCCLLGYV
jgi:hypothetical protein